MRVRRARGRTAAARRGRSLLTPVRANRGALLSASRSGREARAQAHIGFIWRQSSPDDASSARVGEERVSAAPC